MSALVTPPAGTAAPGSTPVAGTTVRTPRPDLRRPSFARLVGVEARKTFDTRAGLWLCASIVVLAVVASAAVVLFAPDEALTFETFASAIGIPMAIVLPVLAILSVTSEWSQRSGLGTFTMVPSRGRVIAAKAAVAAVVGVVSMLVAMGVGALGTVVGSALAGTDAVWDSSVSSLVGIVVANLLGMAVGFMLGVLLRSSPAAIVGYFVYSFVVPTLLMTLATFQDWWADLQPWLDFNYAQTSLFDGWPGGEAWAQIGVSSLPWLVLPLLVGLWTLRRSEVK
ncbi:ABC transporter permease subunit [Nocardioides sp. ChNu-153]|uniref:ABC transporter permease subunit n=1 Tax=unclassified Nocardioides TaxID=2615069 RepID=UPI0024071165|nr:MULTISPECIES: ABC transporter permease subunit [unclassified Nocardioides]MDF9716014.1 ABC transporter permease subunit [Nocardioides sp. ChNu-99]MDN7119982.1 ABC transporter permease subunit [Nocardioides sp. ChNu-153]